MHRTVRVLFRVASGPRRGFGHVMRISRIAAALPGPNWVSILGARPGTSLAASLSIAPSGLAALDATRPDLLVLDTPVARDAARWVAAARRRGVPVASLHDRGLVPVHSDLAIDGSLASTGRVKGAARCLSGPAYAAIDPSVTRPRRPVPPRARRVLIALGGGPRNRFARSAAQHIIARLPELQVTIAGGLLTRTPPHDTAGIGWLGPQRNLAAAFAAADIAVVAGGMTLYEAAAAGVPCVGIAVVDAQRPALRAFARAGAALHVMPLGTTLSDKAAAHVADAVAQLAACRSCRQAQVAAGRGIVDGKGASRVARALVALAERSA